MRCPPPPMQRASLTLALTLALLPSAHAQQATLPLVAQSAPEQSTPHAPTSAPASDTRHTASKSGDEHIKEILLLELYMLDLD